MANIDFRITEHGTVWNIQAVSPEAKAFAEDHFDLDYWQGLSENFMTDHRAGRDLVARLMSEGWRVAI